jgi:integrase
MYQSPASHAEYDRLIAQWLRQGRIALTTPTTPSDRVLVELLLAFDRHLEARLPTTSREPENYRRSLQPLRTLYGDTLAGEFGPKALKTLQQHMMGLRWCRNVINRRIGRVKTFFKWCESEELVRAGTTHALATVRGLPLGMPGVRETARTEPAFWEDAQKITPFCLPPIAAMLQLQWLSAMRSGEVRVLRTRDLDRRRTDVWFYTPGSEHGPNGAHKNAWRGQDRIIAFGPQAIAVVQPWLRLEAVDEYVFSPAQAMQAFRLSQQQARRTPRGRPTARKPAPQRQPGACYSSTSYAHAVQRACRKAGVQFHPYQLRHGRKMAVEAVADTDTARTVLGQRSISSTQLYGKLDVQRAAEVMAKIG